MRQFSSNIQTAIDSQFRYFFLIDVAFNQYNASTSQYEQNIKRFTSYYQDVKFNEGLSNEITYTADGGLFEVDAPSFSSIVDREAYKIVITDKNNEFLNIFKLNAIGAAITVRIMVEDPSTDTLLINSANDISNQPDVVFVYSGFVDGPTVDNDFDQKIAVIEGTSPMADLDQVKVLMVSRSGMDQFDAADTSFDSIFEDNEIHLKWGKI